METKIELRPDVAPRALMRLFLALGALGGAMSRNPDAQPVTVTITGGPQFAPADVLATLASFIPPGSAADVLIDGRSWRDSLDLLPQGGRPPSADRPDGPSGYRRHDDVPVVVLRETSITEL